MRPLSACIILQAAFKYSKAEKQVHQSSPSTVLIIKRDIFKEMESAPVIGRMRRRDDVGRRVLVEETKIKGGSRRRDEDRGEIPRRRWVNGMRVRNGGGVRGEDGRGPSGAPRGR